MDATFLLECLGVHTVWYIVGSIEHQRMRYQNENEDVIVSVALVTRFSHPTPPTHCTVLSFVLSHLEKPATEDSTVKADHTYMYVYTSMYMYI